LPAESAGKVRKLVHWGKTSLSSVAMGQEISTTTLQLARACAVIANGGLLVSPRLVIRRGDQFLPVAPPVRVIKPETAITMRRMMEGVVLHGTGGRARLAGYTSGGKTGSAQIFDTAIGHFTHSYNATFMGFAPVTNPAIVVVVTLNGTHGSSGFGGAVAAPVFRTVASEALRILDVPKDLPEREPPATQVAKAEDMDDLPIADLREPGPTILEEGDDDEAPAGVAPVPDPGSRVPNFQGKTMRAVLAEASAKGLHIVPDGSGTARMQNPPPGAVLRPGEAIRVQFAR
jgi:cell division protein FtsI (penicillin-binding protein 3)